MFYVDVIDPEPAGLQHLVSTHSVATPLALMAQGLPRRSATALATARSRFRTTK
jgi:hypothetical protein